MENEDIQETLKTFPIWNTSVWEPLQKKDYDSAERAFVAILEETELDDWSLIYWQGIFSGIPAVLGKISNDEWGAMVRPILVRAAMAAASGKGLSVIIQNLNPDGQLDFINLFVKNIPGATSDEKLGWLKENKPSLYMFAIAAPGQELGINPKQYPGRLSNDILIKKYRILPINLKNAIFSYEYAEAIFRTGHNSHLADDKISSVARLAGRTLMGFIHPEDFEKEVEIELSVDKRVSDTVSKDIQSNVISFFTPDIKSVYEPTDLKKAAAGNVKDVEISIGGLSFSDGDRNIPVSIPVQKAGTEEPPDEEIKTALNTPFILHEEKRPETVAGERNSFFKSISVPLGFFKSKNQSARTTKPIKVEIEMPKTEKRVVNYSELRTSLSPFENQSFIKSENASSPIRGVSQGVSLGNFEGKKEAAPMIVPETKKSDTPEKIELPRGSLGVLSTTLYEKTASVNPSSPNTDTKPVKSFFGKTDETPNEPGILGTIKKIQPKIEGNTIDLR